MREAIGGTWIFSIVVVFIVLFSSYLAISVNYSKAFKVKDGIINILEKGEGYNTSTDDEIKEYLSNVGYNVYNKCEGYTGKLPSTNNSNSYKYCIKATTNEENIKRTYYSVKVFFKLDLPILGSIFVFPVTGETKAIYYAEDNI